MNIQEIHKKLEGQCPSDYKINEIIQFAYPYRRVRVNATVNKSPEESIQQVYSVFLRTIKAGYNREETIINFLGLHKEDFILRELYFLRERGFVDFADGIWLVTEQGENFVKDNSILKVLEEEEFEFLVDAITNQAIVKDFRLFSNPNIENKLNPEIDFSIRNPELLKNKTEELSDIYKSQNNGKAYLVDYDKSNIKFDKKEYHDYYLIEYIPRIEKENELEPYIEIRNTNKDISKEKRLSNILGSKYPSILYQFSTSDRTSIAKIQEDDNQKLLEEFNIVKTQNKIAETQTLSVWETQAKFVEALKKVKSKILIESPWIKRATLKYLDYIENALKKNVQVIILYGIKDNDEHHFMAIDKLRKLSIQYEKLHLVHLPSHFEEKGNRQMTGTHRKLIIKDNDYYIQGSFNFLSFNKEKGQRIANEESILISQNVPKKWQNVFKEYDLNLDEKTSI